MRSNSAARVVLCFVAAALVLPCTLLAEGHSAEGRTVALGFQAAPFPVFAPALTYNVGNQFAVQLMGRVGIDVDFAAARALIRFNRADNHNFYFSGLIGTFRDDELTATLLGPEQTDTGAGFGVGLGLEYFFSGLPSVGWSLEVDYIRIGFEDKWWEYDYETPQLVMVGGGFNYYF